MRHTARGTASIGAHRDGRRNTDSTLRGLGPPPLVSASREPGRPPSASSRDPSPGSPSAPGKGGLAG